MISHNDERNLTGPAIQPQPYEPPQIRSLGTLADLTQGTTMLGTDGGSHGSAVI
jgi:hypothetical protein